MSQTLGQAGAMVHMLRHQAQSGEPEFKSCIAGSNLFIQTMNAYHYQAIDKSGYLYVNSLHACINAAWQNASQRSLGGAHN